MADYYTAVSDATALAAATAKTVLQIATPSTIRARVRELQISFDGVTSANPAGLVEIVRQTTAGTMSAVTPNPLDSAAPASLATASRAATVEPTTTVTVREFRITPFAGLLVFQFVDDKDQIVVPISGFLGIRCTFAQIVNVNASLTFLA